MDEWKGVGGKALFPPFEVGKTSKSQVPSKCSRTLLSSLGSAVGLFAHEVSLVLTVGWLAGGCTPQVGWAAL